ncbi:ribonuclease H [Euwallacea fornicatus]|uniref:ribonuclease H n=1 Tax=Euwallacea fornicatus TaxID=995702 RepID=UPI00338E7DF8
MHVISLLFESRFFLASYKRPIFSINSFISNVMDNLLTSHASKLLNQLNEAERKARLLQGEIQDIRIQIATLTDSAVGILEGTVVSNTTNNLNGNKVGCSFKRGLEMTDFASECQAKRGKEDFPMENGYVVVYTDGACEQNGKSNARAGIGVWFSDRHPLNISAPVIGRATNNVAEIQAPTKALYILKEKGFKKVKIMTDSQFTINCITKWIKKWKRNQWKLTGGGPVKNKEELIKLDTICAQFEHIKWEYCAGHSGIKGNEEADKLAKQGVLQYQPLK